MRPPSWTAALGAVPDRADTCFRVWAPAARKVEVVLEPGGAAHPLGAEGSGYFGGRVPGVSAGARYRYRLDGGPAYPDPASRYQPDGVHGPSLVVDPAAYTWHDAGWHPPPQAGLVVYELHVGTFSPEGTFEGVRARLPYLRDLGVTGIELMPVGDFPGRWNWGYDVAAPFAPSRAYGMPDDLRRLVDDAHAHGLAVLLDVVYNHLGPDGAYAAVFSPWMFSRTHRTPWGAALNLDGESSAGVRRYVVENALHWLVEYHLDGLRLDATHAIVDDSPRHILAQLADAVAALPGPKRYLVAEDHRNLARLVRPPAEGGYALDAVWSDDYHHQMRRLLAGDRDGYFADFTESTRDLATIVRQGWLFTGQHSAYFDGPRGTDPTGLAPERFVHFLQNHDQIGNRPQGDRLSAVVPPPALRAATALLLFAPQIPLLFMGQEWSAGTPFCYFTDHGGDLGARIAAGRRREFGKFRGFAGEIPDPEAPETFVRSRLDWTEPEREPHAAMLRLTRDLLALRPALDGETTVESPVEGGLVLRRGRRLLAATLRRGVALPWPEGATLAWTTEDPRYAADPHPPVVSAGTAVFPRPAAALAVLR